MLAFLLNVTLSWILIFTFLKYLETRRTEALSEWMERHNVTLSLGYIDFHTTRFNAFLESAGKRNRKWLSIWFQIGVLFGFIGMLSSTLILSGNFLAVVYKAPAEVPRLVRNQNGPIAKRIEELQHGLVAKEPYVPNVIPRGKHTLSHRNTERGFSLVSLAEMFKGRYRHEHTRSQIKMHPEEENVDSQLTTSKKKVLKHFHNTNGILMHGKHSHTVDGIGRPLASDFISRKLSMTGDMEASKRTGLHKRRLLEHIFRKSPAAPSVSGRASVFLGEQKSKGKTEVDLSIKDAEPVGGLDLNEGHTLPYITTRFAVPREQGPERSPRYYSHRGLVALGKAEHVLKDIEQAEEAAKRYLATNGRAFLTPLLPGVNMPLTDLFYVVFAFLLSVVFHELGHALAAGAEDSRVIGVGGFLAVVFPGAYVTLGGIPELSTKRQLRVYCAGAWHNVILAIFCLLAAQWLPLLVSPLYSHGAGALVVSVPSGSPLAGHLVPGDSIISIGPFEVSNGGPSFRRAISKLKRLNDSVGFCVSDAMHRAASLPPANCCPFIENGTEHPSLQCFEALGTDRKTCIPRTLVSGFNTCRSPSECYRRDHRSPSNTRNTLSRSGRMVRAQGPRYTGRWSPMHCYSPILPDKQQLVDIQARSVQDGAMRHYFYQGYPEVLGKSVSVSSFVVRGQDMMPVSVLQLLARLDLPNKIEKLLNFIVGISLGVAVFNMTPVFHLDGASTVMLFVKAMMPNLSEYKERKWRSIILTYGTALLVLNILAAFTG